MGSIAWTSGADQRRHGAKEARAHRRLASNQLSGGIPPALGSLGNLQELRVLSNPLSGALPSALTSLSLDLFYFGDTDLCEPGDAGFQAWLASIGNLLRTGMICRRLVHLPLIRR